MRRRYDFGTAVRKVEESRSKRVQAVVPLLFQVLERRDESGWMAGRSDTTHFRMSSNLRSGLVVEMQIGEIGRAHV